jgi:hypothetical protein
MSNKDNKTAELQWLAQILSNSIFTNNLYNVIEDMRSHAYRAVINATGAEALFRAQGRLATMDEVLTLVKKLRGDK